MTTRLTVYGVPGQEQTFLPKTPSSGKSSDQVTQLSVFATPGQIHTFLPKDPSGGGGKPSDQITALSVMATPSGLRVFVAKTPAAPIPDAGGGKADRFHDFTKHQLEEDEILLMIAMVFVNELS